jgi:DNA-binding helix-hairpin-helix protein with protein kinase domain
VLNQYIQKFTNERQRLNREETARLASLDDAIEQAITHELAQVSLHHADIPGINRLLEVRLRLFGVRTAADIVERRITRVNGIDQPRADSLLAWRDGIEQRVRRQQARLLREWRHTQQATLHQEYQRKRLAVNAEEAAQRQIIDQKTAELERRRQELLNQQHVTFAAYLKWIF